MWLAILLEKFRFTSTWAAGLKSESSFVGNNVIHLNEIGADPTVLIDNTVYPILTTTREDQDITVALKKYETTNTRITDDELYGLPYDKPGSVMAQHRITLEQGMLAHGLYTIAPLSNTARTPIIVTSGEDDGTGRRRMTPGDIIRLKRMYDDAKIPKEGRKLVLAPEHSEDLLLASQVFREQYHIIATGQLLPLYGFELHEDVNAPVYNVGTKVRKAYGAASAPATDANASVAFYNARCFQALGTNKMYHRESALDPETRSSVCGFRQWGIMMPYSRDSQAAIISGRV
ncbi:hypothetical protein D0T11_18685 [Hymenobacter rubripertinctus]|uniref:Uncharacterized protein n=1 Tax=Hymenobacter rubripertinctus TaxID=2029981 RepID=A0A418QMZ5_9BACT|nr:hypothetical protein D0T11_18685 [Hymenobacter rubripertinctus]